MTAHKPITGATDPVPHSRGGSAPNAATFPGNHLQVLAKSPDLTAEAGSPANLRALITADASKVSPRDFIDALGLSSPEEREARRQQSRERCIRAIQNGNTYGFPPMLVEECRHIIAMQSEVRL